MQAFGKPNSASAETEELFAECRDSLIRYLRHYADDYGEAEDICQEAFVRFFRARSEGESITQPRAWVFRVGHNLAVDRGRKRRPELLDESGWLAVEGRWTSQPDSLEAKVHVAQLPWERLSRMEMECLRLRTEGLKFREIGEVLGLSISSVVSYVSRALTKLRPKSEDKSVTPNHGRAAATL